MSKDRPTIDKTPAEKKRLSYERDGRNSYGENAKASRKLIPLRKARESRDDRRKINQALASVPLLGEEKIDLIESSARQDINRVGGWKKSPDIPLGKKVENQKDAAQYRSKAARKFKQENFKALLEDRDFQNQIEKVDSLLSTKAKSLKPLRKALTSLAKIKPATP